MPATGSQSVGNSNIVTQLPALPYPMEFGEVSWSVSFEGQPSGSLTYQGVPEDKFEAIKSAYSDATVTLYGIPFKCSFSYNREGYIYKDTLKFAVYQITIGLSGKYESRIDKEIKLKPLANAQGEVNVSAIASAANVPYGGPSLKVKIGLDADSEVTSSLSSAISSGSRLKGRYISYTTGVNLKSLGGTGGGTTWNFPDTDIITDGPNSLGKGGGYNDAVLTGGFSQMPDPNETGTPPGVPQFQYLGQNTQTVVEEDQDPTIPPPFSKTLRDLTSVFDLSGPKKVRKVTTQVYGQPDTEETWVYGFVYTAEDIGTSSGGVKDKPLKSTTPGIYWKVVEYTKTIYIYTAPPQLSLKIFATDPTNPSKQYPVIIKKGYGQFASVPTSGGNVTFSSTVSYLTSIISQGWKLDRYQKEDEGQYQTFATTDPSYSTYQFFTLPTLSKTTYLLKSSRAQYGEDVGAPFSVEWVNFNDLSASEKAEIGASNQNAQGQVAILTPDINYAEPLFVETETTSKTGFSYVLDPADPKKVLPTGEESYQQVKRTVVGPNQYKEKSTEYSSRDPGFSTSLEQIRFKDVYGRPPEASFRMATAEQVNTQTNTNTNTTVTLKKYTVSTDGSAGLPSGGSLDYSDAETVQEAIKAIETELEIEEIQASTKTKTLTWFYPNIRDGDKVICGADKFLGTWIVKSASWTLNYHGNKANMGSGILVTTDGTQLTLGYLKPRSASYQIQNIPVPSASSAGGDGSITTAFTGGAFELGEAFQNQPNRRNF